jgi:RHS repeat-associated protein
VWHDYADLPGTPPADPAAVRALRTVGDPAAPAVAELEYDASNNLVRRTVGDKTWELTYDGHDELREACLMPDGSCEVYYYDHAGQRMAAFRTAFGAEAPRGRFWFGETEIEYSEDGGTMTPNRTMVFAGLGGMPVARVVDADLTDPELLYSGVLGHLLAVTGPSGVLAARYAYGPFGEILWRDGAEPTDYHRLFNGKELDELTELSYYGFRYYDRLTLSWTQRDPLYAFAPDLAYDQPRRMGLFTFSLNNPLRYVDPDGLDPRRDAPLPESDTAGVPPCSETGDGVCYPDEGTWDNDTSDQRGQGSSGTGPNESTASVSSDYGSAEAPEFAHWLPFVGPGIGVVEAAHDFRSAFRHGDGLGMLSSGLWVGANFAFLYLDFVSFGTMSTLRTALHSSARNGVRHKLQSATRAPKHHIATNKNFVSTARGGPWSQKFEALFKRAGMSLDDELNKIAVPGHKGPHPREYHETIFRRLQSATAGTRGAAYRMFLKQELKALAQEARTQGSQLNKWLTKK